jgi:hypothetical protein
MKNIILIAILFVLISCNTKTELHEALSSNKHAAPISQKGCLASYETVNGETINKTYGGDIKDGHWIHFEFVIPTAKENKDKKVVRAKMEEGYYKENKKEGFWKFYNKDGTLKESVEYKNDVPVR